MTRPPALFLQGDHFMPDGYSAALLDYAVAHREAFYAATTNQAPVDYRHSLVYDDLGPFGPPMRQALASTLPTVLKGLGMAPFEVVALEWQLLAYTDGCYFKAHTDASDTIPSRRISFVYYFYRSPQAFSGGELVMLGEKTGPETRPVLAEIRPRDNTIVFFDSQRRHEVQPVQVPGGKFEDGRFAVVGWFHGPGARLPAR